MSKGPGRFAAFIRTVFPCFLRIPRDSYESRLTARGDDPALHCKKNGFPHTWNLNVAANTMQN